MWKTTVLLVPLALAAPAVAMPHPCEVEVAQMKKDLDGIRGAIATIEAVRPSENQRQVLAGAKGKYDLELRQTTEAQARCDRLVREGGPGATPSPPSAVPASAAPQPAAVPAPPRAVLAVPAPAPEPSGPVRAALETPPTPCLTGCGKDTDCKGDRICVKGACQDPPAR